MLKSTTYRTHCAHMVDSTTNEMVHESICSTIHQGMHTLLCLQVGGYQLKLHPIDSRLMTMRC